MSVHELCIKFIIQFENLTDVEKAAFVAYIHNRYDIDHKETLKNMYNLDKRKLYAALHEDGITL